MLDWLSLFGRWEGEAQSLTMGVDLDSCWARFARAKEHLDALEQDFAAWNNAKPFTIVSETNPEKTHLRWVARQHTPPRFGRWALQLCDAFANLRCSLDHLVWSVAVAQDVFGRPDPPLPDLVSFPIVADANGFKSFEGSRLRNFSQAVRTAIEQRQPYNRRHPRIPPVLWILRTIDNQNKHKLLLPVTYALGSEDSFIRAFGGPLPEVDSKVVHANTELSDGAVLASVTYSRPLEGQVAHHFRATFGVAIQIDEAPDPSVKFRNVSVLFAEIAAEVKETIEAVSAVA